MVSSFLVSPSFFGRGLRINSDLIIYLFPFVIYPLNNISLCASIFMTLALAYERYNAVCRPLHYRDVTARYSIKRRTLRYLILQLHVPDSLLFYFNSKHHSIFLILYTYYILFQLLDSSGHCVRGAERSQIFRVQV